ncbi:aldo/keto reductase [Mycolicibacterium litorale]|uniref:aldo/keto reductase n=1 Tax=Mycolicibacterium litorale TaxID=758802 RepID=UPI003CEF6AAC
MSAIGLGGAPLSETPMVCERERALATIHRALDLGVTLIDTALSYAPSWDTMGHNEALIAEAVRTYTGSADLTGLVVATKGGITRGDGETWGRDGSADGLRRHCEASLRHLNVDVIELYHLHRHDPSRSYAEQVRALAALKDAGLVRRIGLSNVTVDELSVALDIVGGPTEGGVASVQNEYSPRYRGAADVLDRCTESGVAFLAWSPLGGTEQAHDIGSRYAAFAEVGSELGATPQEAVLAWLLRVSPVMIPIPGATRPVSIESSVRAAALELTDDQFARLQATKPTGESRYPDDMPRSSLGH